MICECTVCRKHRPCHENRRTPRVMRTSSSSSIGPCFRQRKGLGWHPSRGTLGGEGMGVWCVCVCAGGGGGNNRGSLEYGREIDKYKRYKLVRLCGSQQNIIY